MRMPPLKIDRCSPSGARRRTAPKAGPAPARRLRRHCARSTPGTATNGRAVGGGRRRRRDQRRLADCVGIARGPRLAPATNGGRSQADGVEGGTSAGSPTASASRAVHAWHRHRTAGARRRTASRAGPAPARRLRRHRARSTPGTGTERREVGGGWRRRRDQRRLADCVGIARGPRLAPATNGGRLAGGRRRGRDQRRAGRLRRHRARSTPGTGNERRALGGGRRRRRDQRRLADCVGIARGPRLAPATERGRSQADGVEGGTAPAGRLRRHRARSTLGTGT
jgi:hypothetical protein